MKNLIFHLKVSRPGLWFQTLWVYLLPTSGAEILYTVPFWIGFIYMTFPLNLLMYGWNDMVDYETDKLNPRKNSFLWGAKGSKEQLQKLFVPIILWQIPFAIYFTIVGGIKAFVIFLLIIFVNALYNLPKHGLRGKPPLELINILGVLIIIPLCTIINNLPSLPWQSLVYLGAFCILGQVIGEIMDIEPDKKAGRQTTATVLGTIPSKILSIGILLAEAALLYFVFHAYFLTGYMILAALWLIFDILYLTSKMPYSHFQFTLFGLALNAGGYFSIIWVWYTEVLHTIS